MNLTGADTVIHFDPWWNPAVEEQATARAHRLGQARSVQAYKLIAAGTVEEKIQALQARKRELFQASVRDDAFVAALHRGRAGRVAGRSFLTSGSTPGKSAPLFFQLCAQQFVIDLARAEQPQLIHFPHFVDAHDPAKTGLREQLVRPGQGNLGRRESAILRPFVVSIPSMATCGPRSSAGIGGGERMLQRRQRNHFAARLEKALETPRKMDEAVGIDPRQIARDVPALAFELVERTRPVVMQIAGKMVGPCTSKRPCSFSPSWLHGIDVHHAHFDAVERLTKGPRCG